MRVNFKLALAATLRENYTPRQFCPNVKATSRRGQLGVGIDALDDLKCPRLNFSGLRVTALIEVNPNIGLNNDAAQPGIHCGIEMLLCHGEGCPRLSLSDIRHHPRDWVVGNFIRLPRHPCWKLLKFSRYFC